MCVDSGGVVFTFGTKVDYVSLLRLCLCTGSKPQQQIREVKLHWKFRMEMVLIRQEHFCVIDGVKSESVTSSATREYSKARAAEWARIVSRISRECTVSFRIEGGSEAHLFELYFLFDRLKTAGQELEDPLKIALTCGACQTHTAGLSRRFFCKNNGPMKRDQRIYLRL